MNDTIAQYLNEIILAALAILVIFIKSWLNDLKKKAEKYYEQRTTTEQRKLLAVLGKEAFSFAETVYKELGGRDKLAKAVLYLQERADDAGIPVTIEEARAAIEAAWLTDKRKINK